MRSSPSISAAMIVLNEERVLGESLESICRQVDEIVVIDTGSTDGTVELARRFGAHVLTKAWCDDFSAARNHSLEQARCDWILYIDADERLTIPATTALRHWLTEDAAACRVMLRPRAGFTRYRELRLFRRDPRIRFQGIIHETVHPDIDTVCRHDDLKIRDTDICLDHVGYDGDLTKKYYRNLPLLERALVSTPERVFLWVDLAQALAGLGRNGEAESAAWRAVEFASLASDSKHHNDGAAAWLCLIGLHLEANPSRAVKLAERASAIYPHNHALSLAFANARFLTGANEEIVPLLEQLANMSAESAFDPLTAYDIRVFGEWPLDLMGAVFARMGKRERAAKAFSQASQLAPDNSSYRLKAAAFKATASL
jgi:tetratricopeptide (TPR) repeat protein